RRTGHRPAVEADPAGGDQALHLAPRGDPGARQHLGHAVAGVGAVTFGRLIDGGLTVGGRRAWVQDMIDHDASTMRIALALAQAAAEAGEAPVGAVIVDPADGAVV